MKRILYLVLVLVIIFFGLTFALQNQTIVELKYYFGLYWSGSLVILLLAGLTFGAIFGYLAGLRMVIKMQRQLVQVRKEIRQIEQEVVNLRALPIKDVL